MKFLKNLFESKERKNNRQENYESFLEFCELFKDCKGGETVYVLDNGFEEYAYFYFRKSLLTYNEDEEGMIELHTMENYPSSLNSCAMYCYSYRDFMKYCKVIPTKEINDAVKKESDRIRTALANVAKQVKPGVYYTKNSSPLYNKYLLNVERVFKCKADKKYYLEGCFGNLQTKGGKEIMAIPIYFFSIYGKGNGIEELK